MKAVIDIGSNSVRLMLRQDEKSKKLINTTKLSEKLSLSGKLSEEAMKRTADAVFEFVQIAREHFAEPYVFATEAVRSAANGKDFCVLIQNCCNLSVAVLSGDFEAKCGFLGVSGEFKNQTITTLDIGGASTELAVGFDETLLYSKSLKLGVVRLFDLCGRDYNKLKNLIENKLKDYGKVPPSSLFLAVGGTATTLAAFDLSLKTYNPEIVHRHIISLTRLEELTKRLFQLSVEEIKKTDGISPERAEVISGGALLLTEIMKYLKVDSVTVSENDNLEGYLLLKNS